MTDKDIYLVKKNYLFCLLLGMLCGLILAVIIIILYGPCGDGSTLMLD